MAGMKVSGVFVLALALFAAVVAAKTLRPVSLQHVRRVSAKDSVSVLVAVNQRNLDVLADTCTSVSDPHSAQYGKYLSHEELAAMVGNPTAVHRVTKWLRNHKASQINVLKTKDFVRAKIPAQVAEKAFNVELHVFNHPTLKKQVIRADRKFTLPAELRSSVQHITGLEPVKMDAPKALSAPSLSHKRSSVNKKAEKKTNKKKIGDEAGYIYLDDLEFVNSTGVFVAFDMACADDSDADEDWPCSSTSNPVTSVNLVVKDFKKGTTVTYSITSATASQYNFVYDEDDYVYEFTIPKIAVQFGYYAFNITAIFKSGDDTGVDSYPEPYDGLDTDPFIVNTVAGIPSVFHTLYNVPATATVAAGNSLAMAAFMGQCYSPDDLDQYLQLYNVSTTSKDVTIIGYNEEDESGDETMLDLDMETSIAPNVPISYIYTGDDDQSMDFVLEWAANVSTWENAPLVHSISYGLPESMYDEYFGIPIDEYASRTNAELQKICTLGYTVLVASGDGGSTDIGHGGDDCTLAPMYPASSPYVTSVGATATDDAAGYKPSGAVGEVVVSIRNGQFWTTGGGFSSVASQTQPSYQSAAVKNYLNIAKWVPKGFNSSLRAYPDIAALGDNIFVVCEGELEASGGTSASSPMTAAMIAHLNGARLAAGKSAIGFFNPLLYTIQSEHPDAFFDVTIGDISCGDEECCPQSIGYPAAAGWDPASGVGTIADLTLLTKYVLQY